MGFLRKHIWTTILMTGAAVPLVGLMVYAHRAQIRSAADLAVADRCMEWASESRAAQANDGSAIAAKCNQYFRIRSDDNAAEDIRRWDARTARGAAAASTTPAPPER